MDLRSLQHGPQTRIEHDEKSNGSFRYLAGPLPIAMMTHFSTTIQQQLNQFVHSSSLPFAQILRPQSSQIVQIRGTDRSSLKQLFVWMSSSAQNGTILSLNTVITDPVRYILAMACIRNLGIHVLDHAIPAAVQQLGNNSLTYDQVRHLMAVPPEALLPELRHAIIGQIARQFCTGTLSETDRYMLLSKLNSQFDTEVAANLKDLRERGWHPKALFAEGIWLQKSIHDYEGHLKGNGNQQYGAYSQPYISHSTTAPGYFANMSAATPACGYSSGIPVPPPPPPPPVQSYDHHQYQPSIGDYHNSQPTSNSIPYQSAPMAEIYAGPNQGYQTQSARCLDALAPPIPPPPPQQYSNNTHCSSSNQCRHSSCSSCSHHHKEKHHRHGHHSSHHDHTHRVHFDDHPSHRHNHHSSSHHKHYHGSNHSPGMIYSSTALDSAAHEPARPGENLKSVKNLGNGQYVYVFVDRHGRERWVSKGPGFRSEGSSWKY